MLLFILSILPVLIIGIYIYNKDKEKEPLSLLAKLFFGGVGACFLSLLISFLLEILFPFFAVERSTLKLSELFVSVFIGVALVEEFSKWVMVYRLSYYDYEYDETLDMVLYCVFVALGFACFENLLYVYYGGVMTGVLRAVLAVPGHACDGLMMGYYLSLSKTAHLNKQKALRIKYTILSILVPTILHGIYDYCLYTRKMGYIVLFFVFIVCLYVYTITVINKTATNNRRFKYKDNFCSQCGTKVESEYCPLCGKKNE